MITTKIIDASPKPNQMIARGTQTMLGTLCSARIIDPSVSSSAFTFASITPSNVPIIKEKANPMSKWRKLATISQISVISLKPAYISFATESGLGIIDSGQIPSNTIPCQSKTRVVKKTIRLPATAISQLLFHYLLNFTLYNFELFFLQIGHIFLLTG